jgi:hypothetical protein
MMSWLIVGTDQTCNNNGIYISVWPRCSPILCPLLSSLLLQPSKNALLCHCMFTSYIARKHLAINKTISRMRGKATLQLREW